MNLVTVNADMYTSVLTLPDYEVTVGDIHSVLINNRRLSSINYDKLIHRNRLPFIQIDSGDNSLYIFKNERVVVPVLSKLNIHNYSYVNFTKTFKLDTTPKTKACILKDSNIEVADRHLTLLNKPANKYALGSYFSKIIISIGKDAGRFEYSNLHSSYMFFTTHSNMTKEQIEIELSNNSIMDYTIVDTSVYAGV